MDPVVEIAFECVPLRSLGRFDIPLDASDLYRDRLERMRASIESHGLENSYYLHTSRCVFRLANSEIEGMLRFEFEGTLLTDSSDSKSKQAELAITFVSTIEQIPEEVIVWFTERVCDAVLIEFDRFIKAGSLALRVAQIEKELPDLDTLAGRNV